MKLLLFVLSLGLLGSCVKDESQTTKASMNGDGGDTGSPVLGTDPLAAYAWHLNNTGQTSFSTTGGSAGEDINLEAAMALGYKGKNVRIAVSDSGVELNHPDLVDNELSGEHRSYSSESSSKWRGIDPTPTDGEAHGTAVTGLIAALGWNNIGSRGVAPEAKFAGFRYIMNYPTTITESSMLARTLDQLDGDFDIFNYSYGSSSCSFDSEVESEMDAVEAGITTLRNGKGTIYVQSAGNDYTFEDSCVGIYGNSNREPSLSTPYKIVTGAVNALGVRSSYSTPGSSLWVSAPGGEFGTTSPAMITTDITTCNYGQSQRRTAFTGFNGGYNSLNLNCNFTSTMNGTSAAAPIVSGVVALMLEANPNLSWRDVKHILASTSDMIDYNFFDNVLTHPGSYDLPGYVYDYKWVTNSAGYNFSNWYGFGRIDAAAAVEMAKTYSVDLGSFEQTINPNTTDWYYTSSTVDLSIPDYDTDGVSSNINVLHNFIVESIQVRLTTTHTAPGELAIHLVSPSGTESRLLTINSYLDNTSLDADFPLISNAFYGEEAYGTWSLKIYDGTPLSTGNLTSWKINISGHRKNISASNGTPSGAITMNSIYGSPNSSPFVSFIPSASSNVIRYEVAVGTAPGRDDKYTWTSIGTSTSFQVRNLRLSNRTNYYINIRSVDLNEKNSAIVSKSWYVNY